MKPVFAVLSNGIELENVFVTQEIKLQTFSNEFHFHKECQLVYIVESSGKKIIGDHVDDFERDELIFLGSNTPHVWYNNSKKADAGKESQAHSLSLFFDPSKLLKLLSAFCNVHQTEAFLSIAQRGIEFKGEAKQHIVKLLKAIFNQDGIRRIITLLEIINAMGVASNYRLLASINYVNYYKLQDSNRLDHVFKYIFNHFKEDIPLSTIADIASMNAYSFCRLFKATTQRSFTQFVNETRIGYACSLLNDKNSSITDIAYECGFNNVSNFNRFFKTIKKLSPREYRKQLFNAQAFEDTCIN